jgi:hypothetical protein
MKKLWRFSLSVSVIVLLAMVMSSCQLPFLGEKPPCGQSVLKIGETTYQIKEVKTRSDGSLNISSKTSGVAYWIDQTQTNYVFALSPTSENLALQNENPSDAKLTWSNCNSSSYILFTPQVGVPDVTTLLDQSFSGITIFVQGNNGFVIHGELAGEEIQTFNTPDPSSIQAEISLLETIPSADKTTLTVKVSIANYGQDSIALTPNDVSLSLRDSVAAAITSEPALPKEIASGTTETFSFTFSYPPESGATLKVLSVEYELEY